MLSGPLRELTKSILSKKGMIKAQTVHEKYQKVFDKYTLSPEELKERAEEMAARLKRRKKPEVPIDYEDLSQVVVADLVMLKKKKNDKEVVEKPTE